jgi:hypothetical protein
MNRRVHLQQTLSKNLSDNSDYDQVEFVLLDYNSTDNLEEYIREYFSEYLHNGRLVYYKTRDPKYFDRSHSRNMAFRLAAGEVVCNLDADNFTGKGFAAYINSCFKESEKSFFTTFSSKAGRGFKKDILGRICILKSEFMVVSGYDESMTGYGFEDLDLIQRLRLSGLKDIIIDDRAFLHTITHDDCLRTANEYLRNSMYKLLIRYLNPSSSEVIILLAQNQYIRGNIIDNLTIGSEIPRFWSNSLMPRYQYSILNNEWNSGTWKIETGNINLINSKLVLSPYANGVFMNQDNDCDLFYEMGNENIIEEVVMFCSEVTNRNKMERNIEEKRIRPNVNSIGAGKVYKNFQDAPIICI